MMVSNSKVYEAYDIKNDSIYPLHLEIGGLKRSLIVKSQTILHTFFKAFKDNLMRVTFSVEQCQYN